MPACVVFIANAFFGGVTNPFGSQYIMQLCTPIQNNSVNGMLPYPFHSEYEQAFAGVLMLGVHKASILISCRLGNNTDET